MFIIAAIILLIAIVATATKTETVVYFYKPGCPYCVAFDPIWEKHVAPLGVKFVKVNILDAGKHANILASERARGMQGVPLVAKYKKIFGIETRTEFSGERTIDNLNRFIIG